MTNKLSDLNNHLFAQIERLGDESLDADALAVEIDRSKALVAVAHQIIDNGTLVFNASKAIGEGVIRAGGSIQLLGLDAK